MFEFDKYEPARRTLPMATPMGPTPVAQEPMGAAFLIWGEHCIECAAPACFRTCDLYVPRPDGRCRRFQFGMAPNVEFRGSRGPAAELVFGRWAKLEARGNARIMTNRRLHMVERVASALSRLLDTVGKVVEPVVRDVRWKYLAFACFERINAAIHRMGMKTTPDAFLIDVYNPTPKDAVFTVSFIPYAPARSRHLTADALPYPYRRRLTIPPGRYHETIPYAEFKHIVESGMPFNIALTPQGEEGAHLVFMALDLAKLTTTQPQAEVQPRAKSVEPAGRRPPAKCVVFDLDGTLWEGVLLETDDVRLRATVRRLLQTLDERGVLLSVASKNAHDHAMAKLKEFGIDEYFIFPKINWGSKSENLRQIAKDIDIGLDTFVFVDDNPFELDEVTQALASVECIHVDRIESLLSHPRLQGSTSAEARTRRALYRTAMARSDAQSAFGSDYTAFLKASDIRITIRHDRPEDFERIAELVQRTNQLNFSGHKYSRQDLLTLFKDPVIERYVIACRDRYGEYGTVGFCMASRDGATVRVRDLMLSCRVQGKSIESALFDYLCAKNNPPAMRLAIDFAKTDRNVPAQHVLTKLGFDLNASPLIRDVTAGTFHVDFITLET